MADIDVFVASTKVEATAAPRFENILFDFIVERVALLHVVSFSTLWCFLDYA